MKVLRWIKTQLCRMHKFLFYDIPGILYDFEPDGKGYLSLPRLMFGMSGLLISVAYIREHMFGVPYENMGQLVTFFGAAAAGYVGKRFANAKVTCSKMGQKDDGSGDDSTITDQAASDKEE